MHRLLNVGSVSSATGYSKAQVYKLISEGKFPRQITMGRRSFWVKAEVDDWIQGRIAERDAKTKEL